MIPAELISDLELMGPQERRVFFHWLGDHIREAQLEDGRYPCGVVEFAELFHQWGDAAARRSRALVVDEYSMPPADGVRFVRSWDDPPPERKRGFFSYVKKILVQMAGFLALAGFVLAFGVVCLYELWATHWKGPRA